MPTPSYITAQDLVDALSLPTYYAIFDDANTGVRNTVDTSTPVATVLRRALVWVASWLPDIYDTLPPEQGALGVPTTTADNIPALFKDACLQRAVILAYRRHPEYVKTYGAEADGPLMKELVDMMRRIQAGTQRVTKNDTPPQTLPGNIGGSSISDGPRIAMSNIDGTKNIGDF